MQNKTTIAHAILWTAAVLSSALLHAPAFLTLVLLPLLAVCALTTVGSRRCEPEHPTE